MKTFRIAYRATSTSSLVHGGKTLGTSLYLRRERFLTPAGPEDVPVVSGNALRGVLRDVGARLTWHALGEPKLPMGVADVLWSGGSLAKAKGEPVTGARLAEVRGLFPHVGLFGAAGGGRLIEGSLSVGKLIPICDLTVHVVPPEHRPEHLPDVWDLTQVEEFSRVPGRDLMGDSATAGSETASEGAFRYGVESFIVGTTFSSWIAVTNATDAEIAFLHDVVEEFKRDPAVGGKTHTGHGRLDLDDLQLDRPDVDWAAAAADDLPHAREVLRWLG